MDVADAILGRSTRASLPPRHLLPGVGYDVELALPGKYTDAHVMLYDTDGGVLIIIWPMVTGPREDN